MSSIQMYNICLMYFNMILKLIYLQEFTVNIQPFSRGASIPKLKSGLPDYRYFSIDCFHFSQRLHAQGKFLIRRHLIYRKKHF